MAAEREAVMEVVARVVVAMAAAARVAAAREVAMVAAAKVEETGRCRRECPSD